MENSAMAAFFSVGFFVCSKADARVSDALNSTEIRVHRRRTSNSFHSRRRCDYAKFSECDWIDKKKIYLAILSVENEI